MPSQKSKVCEILERGGALSRADFHWREAASRRGHRAILHELVHSRTGFYFHFDLSDHAPYIVARPGRDSPQSSGFADDWQEVCALLDDWRKFLIREQRTPDPWQALANLELVTDLAVVPNEPLTNEEKAVAKSEIERVQGELIAHGDVSPELVDHIRDTCNYLRDAADRVGRRDWLAIAAGTAMQIALSVYPEEVRYVLSTFAAAIQSVFRHLFGAASLPPS